MFTHLHTHSEFSTLDGLARIDKLVAHAKREGYNALALTDHGSTSGLFSFWKECNKQGIKPILGTEFYYEFEDDEKQNGHLIVLAKDNEGLSNIFQLQKLAYTTNFYRKPRVNLKMLRDYADGIIVTSACIASEINSHLLEGNIERARELIIKMVSVFGEDFYLEIQPNSIPEVIECNKRICEVAEYMELPLVVGGDIHYLTKEKAYSHEVLLACQSKRKMSDPKRFKFSCDEFYMKNEQEVRESLSYLPPHQVDEAIKNTGLIADMCNASFTLGETHHTEYWNIPEGKGARELLCEKAIEGIKWRGLTDKEYVSDIQQEIDVIDRNGYSNYMMVVQDYVMTAKANNVIVGDGRGSASGSKLAYVLGIHDVEPRSNHLIFERFMADGRVPDIDQDFSDQDAVFKDLQSKYGEDSVARIIAFGTMTPKAVFRKVASAFGLESYEINRISKDIADDVSSIEEAMKSSQLLKNFFTDNPSLKDICEDMEGIISHEGMHAGGVVVFPNVYKHLPCKSLSDDRNKLVVAFDKYMIEELGYPKYDVLGLETLPIVRQCLDTIGTNIDFSTLDYDDENIYEMLCEGDVSCVFQLSGQKDKVVQQQPKCFNDLIAINALIRPMEDGAWEEYVARRRGKEWRVHSDRESYMNDTEGIMTYQEQYMLDAQTFAGWDLASADKLIRKKKVLVDDVEYRQKFINDSLGRGYAQEDIEEVMEQIANKTKAGYDFNKSHAASYAMLSFKTAWLKYYYPLEFYASMMSFEDTGTNGSVMINQYIMELKQRGFSVLPPNINTSNDTFKVEDGAVRYKLTGIKTVGETAYKHICKLRPIKNFDDLLERRERAKLKNNVLVMLIKAGVFDEFGDDRFECLAKVGYDVPSLSFEKVRADWEKESLGVYLNEHPMSKFGFESFNKIEDGSECWQGGEVVEVAERKQKNGKIMAFITLETLSENVKVLVFAKLYEDTRHLLTVGELIKIQGKKDKSSLLANQIKLLERR